MNKIAVFCSASDDIAPVFKEKAKELGAWLGQHHKWLVYGGVVPTKLEEHGRVSELLDVTFHSVNLSDRKDIMLQESEVMVALPGGIGTLDEVFHVMASCSIGYHDKKVIFYNVDGFWDELQHFLGKLEELHFAHHPLSNFYEVANTLEELTRLLE